MDARRWQARFTEYLALRQYTARTIEGYRYALGTFFEFLAEQGLENLAEVTREVVDEYRGRLFHEEWGGRRRSLSTQSAHLSALKTFFGFLRRERFLLVDPMAEVALPKVPRHLPRGILSPAEAAAVIEAVETGTPLGIRDRAILEVLYGSALRNSEACGLRLEDVDLAARRLAVREGKGRKSRVVPLGEEAAAWLLAYLERARPYLAARAEVAWLFLSCRGRRLVRVDLARIVAAAARAAGVEKPVTPHTLRHACATHMLRHGAGLRHLQEMLGHASAATTQRYTHLEISDLQRIHRRCHPRERGKRR